MDGSHGFDFARARQPMLGISAALGSPVKKEGTTDDPAETPGTSTSTSPRKGLD
jgi:hypothetical protein